MPLSKGSAVILLVGVTKLSKVWGFYDHATCVLRRCKSEGTYNGEARHPMLPSGYIKLLSIRYLLVNLTESFSVTLVH